MLAPVNPEQIDEKPSETGGEILQTVPVGLY